MATEHENECAQQASLGLLGLPESPLVEVCVYLQPFEVARLEVACKVWLVLRLCR
jgi:hypothetical protein